MKFCTIATVVCALILSGVWAENVQRQGNAVTQTARQDERIVLFHDIFKVLGVPVESTLEAMNAYAQKHWLRKPGKERWEMPMSEHQAKSAKLKVIFKHLKMLDEVKPTVVDVDYAVVLGATVSCMRSRIQNLMSHIDSGELNPRKIVVLTGERALDVEKEKESVLMDDRFICEEWQRPERLPQNECEAVQFVWDQLPKSERVKKIQIQFIATPMIEKNGMFVRPGTADITQTWLNQMPKTGRIVAVSSNPYVPFQEESMKIPLIKAGWFKQGGSLEVIGSASSGNTEISIQLDNVARYMYSILQTQKAKREAR